MTGQTTPNFLTDQAWIQAEEARKARRWAEALALFQARHAVRPGPGTAWRIVHCLRHQEQWEEAIKLAVNLMELLGGLAEATGRQEAAAGHLGLALAIRRQEGWVVTARLWQAVERFGGLTEGPQASVENQWRLCRNLRGEQTSAAQAPVRAPVQNPRNLAHGKREGETLAVIATGLLLWRGGDVPFGFIRTSAFEDQVFVRICDVPEGSRHDGAKVSFRAVRSFDRKKNRDGVRAMDVRPQAAAASDEHPNDEHPADLGSGSVSVG